jgi:hypothetical protein
MAWLRVSYRLDRDGEEIALVREERRWGGDEAGGDPVRRETLGRFRSGRFAVGILNEDGALTWASSWDSEAHGVPRLVKVDVTFPTLGASQPLTLSRVIRHPAGTLPKAERP